jgi:hypothetical protein
MSLPLPSPNPNVDRADYLRRRPKKWWHDSIIDDMLAAPLDTVKVRALRLGYTPAGLQMILNSDMFRAAYAARRKHFEEHLDATLIHKTAKFAERGLDILLEQLETKRTSLPFQAVSDAVIGPNGALARLGYGSKSGPGMVVNVNSGTGAGATVMQVAPEDLAAARARLRSVEQASLPSPERRSERTLLTVEANRSSPASFLPDSSGEAEGGPDA